MKLLWILLSTALLFGTASSSHKWARTDIQGCSEGELIKGLLSERRYCSYVRPKSESGPLIVGHRFELLRIVDVIFTLKILIIEVLEDVAWTDERLRWDTGKCNVGTIRVPLKEVWIPDLEVLYSAAPVVDKVSRNLVVIDSMGHARYTTDKQIRAYCDSITPPFNPGEEYNCTMIVQSWSYGSSDLTLQVLGSGGSGMNLGHYEGSNNPDWELVSTHSTTSEIEFDCCPDPFFFIDYVITLRYIGP